MRKAFVFLLAALLILSLSACGARSAIMAALPDEAEIPELDRIIFDELCRGEINDDSRTEFLRIIDGLRGGGFPHRA